MKKFTVETRWCATHDCFIVVDKYADNDHVALGIWSEEEGPFARLTVNLEQTAQFPENFGFLDVNNFPEAEKVVRQLGIGKPTGFAGMSGFCSYPLYEFDPDAIREYTMEEVVE